VATAFIGSVLNWPIDEDDRCERDQRDKDSPIAPRSFRVEASAIAFPVRAQQGVYIAQLSLKLGNRIAIIRRVNHAPNRIAGPILYFAQLRDDLCAGFNELLT
jgi:hypothetical protein